MYVHAEQLEVVKENQRNEIDSNSNNSSSSSNSINNNVNEKREVSEELPHTPELDEVVSFAQVMFVSCNRHDRSQDYWASMATAAQCEMATKAVKESNPFCVAMYDGKVAEMNSKCYDDNGKLTLSTITKNTLNVSDNIANVSESSEVPVGGCGSVLDSPEAQHFRLVHVKTEMEEKINKRTEHNLKQSSSNQESNAQHNHCNYNNVISRTYNENLERLPSMSTVNTDEQMQSPPLDALLWLGDAIYADKRMTRRGGMPFGHVKYPLSIIRQMWETQHAAPEYVAFRESCLTRSSLEEHNQSMANVTRSNVYGTWDDHDMGANDAGKEYPFKNVTQEFLLHFLDAPSRDVRWRRAGVYTFHTIPFHEVLQLLETSKSEIKNNNTSNSSNNNKDRSNKDSMSKIIIEALKASYTHAVCLILLDVRSFRDPPNATNSGDMLGEPQWRWLESLLQNNITGMDRNTGKQPCALTLIASGIQLMLDEKISENWAAFPHSRDRLLHLLRSYHVERVAFLTGDVHMGELGLDTSPFTVEHALGYPFVEATSSGLTHSVGDFPSASLYIHKIFSTWRRVGVYPQKNFASTRLGFNPYVAAAYKAKIRETLETIKEQMQRIEEAQHTESTQASKGNKVHDYDITQPGVNDNHNHNNIYNNNINNNNIYNNSNSTNISLVLDNVHRDAQMLRSLLEELVNVTFTVYAIPKAGAPVLRLTFPLSMLTYNKSWQYINRHADFQTGFVQEQREPSEPTFYTLHDDDFANVPIRLYYGAANNNNNNNSNNSNNTDKLQWTRIIHYPNTQPVPFITALSRFMQRHVFTTRSVTASAIATLELLVGLTGAILLLLICICCPCSTQRCCCCCCSGFSRRYCSQAENKKPNQQTRSVKPDRHERITYKDIKRKVEEQKKEHEKDKKKRCSNDVVITLLNDEGKQSTSKTSLSDLHLSSSAAGNSKLSLRGNGSIMQSIRHNDNNNSSNDIITNKEQNSATTKEDKKDV